MSKPNKNDLPYRPNVGILLLNPQGRIFCGRRIDQSVEGWQMPQGGIDAGETPETAALRELKEEVGTDKAEIVRPLDEWLTYDLPDHLIGVALHGKYRGQRQKWFALRFTGEERDIDLTAFEPEFDAWEWVDGPTLMERIVPFKRAIYRQVLAGFADLVAK